MSASETGVAGGWEFWSITKTGLVGFRAIRVFLSAQGGGHSNDGGVFQPFRDLRGLRRLFVGLSAVE